MRNGSIWRASARGVFANAAHPTRRERRARKNESGNIDRRTAQPELDNPGPSSLRAGFSHRAP